MAKNLSRIHSLHRTAKVFTSTFKRHQEYIKVSRLKQDEIAQEECKRKWAADMLEICNVSTELLGTPAERGTLLVGNHISYLDIPLLMKNLPVRFLAKKELKGWPIIGSAIHAVGTVFIDRSSPYSRKMGLDKLGSELRGGSRNVVIFPSGTTAIDESKPWRWGAFELAKTFGIPLQPFRLTYEPLREAAFINDDALVPHLIRLISRNGVRVKLEFHEPIQVGDPKEEAHKWQKWTQSAVPKI